MILIAEDRIIGQAHRCTFLEQRQRGHGRRGTTKSGNKRPMTRRAGWAEPVTPANKTLFTSKHVYRQGSWDERCNRRAKERWEASYRTKWAKGIQQEGIECYRSEEEGTEESIVEKNERACTGEEKRIHKEKRRSEKEARAKKERCAEEEALVKEKRMRKESALRQAEAAETKSAVTESRANKWVAERGS